MILEFISINHICCKYFSDDNLRTLCINSIRVEKERLSWKTFSKRLIDFSDNLYKIQ